MKDVFKELEENPIQQINTPNDKCPFKECDGTGFKWFKDYSYNVKIRENGKLTNEEMKGKKEWMEPCRCKKVVAKQKNLDKLLSTSRIPDIFKNASVDNFSTGAYTTEENRQIALLNKTAAKNFVKNFEKMKESGKGLFLYSQTKGSGKTRLASSIVNDLLKEKMVGAIFVKASNLSKEVRKTYSKDSNINELDVIRTFQEAELLVIDDIAVDKPTEFLADLYFNILDYRLEKKLPTIFTSNLTIEEFEDRPYFNELYDYNDPNAKPEDRLVSSRVGDRLRKMAFNLYMPEESIRKREAEYENNKLEDLLFGGE